MGVIGVIKSEPEILMTKNGETKAVFLSVQFTDESDVRSVQYMPGAGNDDCPLIGDIVCAEMFGAILVATAVKSAGDPEAKPGERHITARDSSGATAKIDLLPDGTVRVAAKDAAKVSLLPDGTINIAAKDTARADLLPDGTINIKSKPDASGAAASFSLLPDGTVNIETATAKIGLLPAGTVNVETQAGAQIQAQSTGLVFAGNKQADIQGLFDDIFTGLTQFATALSAATVEPAATAAAALLTASIPQWQAASALFLSGAPE